MEKIDSFVAKVPKQPVFGEQHSQDSNVEEPFTDSIADLKRREEIRQF